jgi:hypothetical protein
LSSAVESGRMKHRSNVYMMIAARNMFHWLGSGIFDACKGKCSGCPSYQKEEGWRTKAANAVTLLGLPVRGGDGACAVYTERQGMLAHPQDGLGLGRGEVGLRDLGHLRQRLVQGSRIENLRPALGFIRVNTESDCFAV